MKSAGIESYETIGSFKGAELEYIKTKHPLYDRLSPVIVGDHVTLESGTGCVHTAPGYGVEDFEVCKNYDDIDILVCVDARGRQTEEAGEFAGLIRTRQIKLLQLSLRSAERCWRVKKLLISILTAGDAAVLLYTVRQSSGFVQ